MSHPEDEIRFSRQAPLLGEDGMKCISSSTVLIHGLGGVGVEIGILPPFHLSLFLVILISV